MSTAQAEALKMVLSSIFSRKGSNGRHLRLVDAFSSEERNALLAVAGLGDDELPILGSLEATDRWLMLTTSRLLWRTGEDRFSIPNESILEATLDLEGLRTRGLTKLEAAELEIRTGSAQYTVQAEPGGPLSGLWNALMHLAIRNRRGSAGSSRGNRERGG